METMLTIDMKKGFKDFDEELEAYLSSIPICACGRRILEEMGYFEAPASGHHHLAEHGGLVKHSVNVTRWLLKLSDAMKVPWPKRESPYIVGMLHDVIKAKCYAFQAGGAEESIIRVPNPYAGHGSASAIIVCTELGLQLHPAEAAAIVHHMGAFNLSGYELKDYDNALKLYPKEIIATHTADMLASRWDEEYALGKERND